MSDKVTIGWAHPGEVANAFADSVMRTIVQDAARPAEERRICTEGSGYLHIASGPRIASARNHLVRMFLEHHTSEWLWMLDADITFPPNTLDLLLEGAARTRSPVVGGLYFAGGRGFIIPMLYEMCDPAENDGTPVRYITEWEEGADVRVDATGAGCLLMHRSVLEEMRETSGDHWFHESIYKGQEFGEDWTFCMKVGQMGYGLHIITSAKCGHVKSFELTEDVWRTGKVPLTYVGKQTAEPHRVLNVAQPLNRQQRRALERTR